MIAVDKVELDEYIKLISITLHRNYLNNGVVLPPIRRLSVLQKINQMFLLLCKHQYGTETET